MDLLLLLLTAHFIGDFYLQPTKWIECRNKNKIKSPSLRKHLIIHALLNSAVFLISSYSFFQAAFAVAIISFTHFIIDSIKSYLKNNLTYFLLDQIIHILVIVSVWVYLRDFTADEIKTFFTQIISAKNVVIIISYLLVCKPASVLISLALQKHTNSLKKPTNSNTQKPTVEVTNNLEDKVTVTINTANKAITTPEKPQENQDNVGLISAGALIGYIERCLAISFIFMGQFAGIGFLVATKTIFRFGDLTKSKDMKLTEYMLLGTLLSYAIALFIGWNAVQIYKLI